MNVEYYSRQVMLLAIMASECGSTGVLRLTAESGLTAGKELHLVAGAVHPNGGPPRRTAQNTG